MSVSSPGSVSPMPSMKIKFLKITDLSEQQYFANAQHNLAQVSTGHEVVTDKFVSSMGMSPCLGILMSDGRTTYFRHHCPGMGDGELLGKIRVGLKQLNPQKLIQGVLVGGQDDKYTNTLIGRVAQFFRENQVRFSLLAPHADRNCKKVTNLLFNPQQQELLLTNDDSRSFIPDFTRPLLQKRADADRFYRNVEPDESAQLVFAEPTPGAAEDIMPHVQELPGVDAEEVESEPGCICC
jgi:hypothetical protein